MKIKYFVILLLMLTHISFAQQYGTSSITSGSGQSCFGVQFLNANTGFAIVQQNGVAKLAKTTNKGLNWQYSSLLNSQYPEEASMQIINENTFFIAHGNYLDKTTNGGANWFQTNFGFNPGNSFKSPIKFFNASIGYWVIRRNNETYDLEIYKTSDGGSNWSQVFTYSSNVYTYYIKDIAFDPVDPNIVAFAGWAFNRTPNSSSYANYVMFITYDGMSNPGNVTKIEDGHASNSLSGFSSVQIVKNDNNQREFRMILNRVTSTVDNIYCAVLNSTLSEYFVAEHGSISNVYTGNGIKFTDFNNGYLLAQGKIYKTTNAGVNWSIDYSIYSYDNSFYQRLNVIGNIIYAANFNGTLAIRRLNSNLTTFRDNISISSSFGIQDIPGASGYNTYNTPVSSYLYGGNISMTTNYFINENQSNEAIFYKWSTGESITNPSAYLSSDGVFSTSYKTKNLSTDNTAISKSASTKSLKEAHGNIDRIQTSIGGIFFSRSTNNGTTFGHEEVVNTQNSTATNNINPYLAEVKTILSGGVDAGKNSAVVWERRDADSIFIMYSQRETIGGSGSWGVDLIDPVNNPYGNSFKLEVPGNLSFESKPKLSVIKSDISDNRFTVISYLKPDGNSYKLMARVHVPGISPVDRVISAGNISDFAIYSKPKTSGSGHDIYYAFLRDNHVFYKTASFYVYGAAFATDSTSQTNISSGDGAITFRYSPDISLRNGLPVITYQGKYAIARAYNIDGATGLNQATVVNMNFYPIVVKYATSSTSWSSFIMYNSDGVSSQQNPNIEGCTNANAYMVNFSKNNNQFKHFVKGDNLNGYYCEPSTFTGTDVKLVRNSYTSATGGAIRTTLNPSNSLYSLGESNISVTNSNIQSQDNAFGNIKGVVNMNSTDYVFNLGPIIIQSGQQEVQEIDMNAEPPALTSSAEFNEYMTSSPFTMHTGDTLIIGTSAFHKKCQGGEYYPMKYTVNLYDYSTNEVFQELFSDTLNLEDESIVEYYRGYVMNNLEVGGTFYIQIQVEDLSGKDAIYTLSGVYDGDEPSGDNMAAGKIYVDFKNSGNQNSHLNVKPSSYSLTQNYPNPFNPTTTIKYSIPKDGLVKIRVYDISGREVANLINEVKTAGNYEVKFNGSNLSSGMYFYRIESGEFVETRKMILIK
ncbi:MAG: T9SS type A sorting domain-containing protein [Bacteroidetes bacterium]|nr:T9SS type A sorting domain-containing protein [Bacteroidota bacterium]